MRYALELYQAIEFNSVLASIGIKLAKPVQKLVDGVRERIYRVDDSAMKKPARLEVLQAIARKFDRYLESEAVAKVNWEESPPLDPVVEIAATTEVAIINRANGTGGDR